MKGRKYPMRRFAALLVAATAGAQAGSAIAQPVDLCALPAAAAPDLRGVCADVRPLGNGTFASLQLVPAGLDLLVAVAADAEGRAELAAAREFFSYGGVVITVGGRTPAHLDMVLRAASALDTIRRDHPAAHDLLQSLLDRPTAPSLPQAQWKNRVARLFLSFDRTPQSIAASATRIGTPTTVAGVQHFDNYAVLSIDEVTIAGADAARGSRRIYERPAADENYRLYMADGLVFSIVHELVHLHASQANGTSRLANAVAARASAAAVDAEEIVANETAIALLRGRVSPQMRRQIVEENTTLAAKPGVREELAKWRALASRASQLVVPD